MEPPGACVWHTVMEVEGHELSGSSICYFCSVVNLTSPPKREKKKKKKSSTPKPNKKPQPNKFLKKQKNTETKTYKQKSNKQTNAIFILVKPWIFQVRLPAGALYLCVRQHWQSCLFLISRKKALFFLGRSPNCRQPNLFLAHLGFALL